MKYLLDTHLLIWAAEAPEKLPPAARELFETPATSLSFSVVSIWETAIKAQKHAERFTTDAQQLLDWLREGGFDEINLTAEHMLAAASLPPLHADPFDRALVAQAQVEGLRLVTKDRAVIQYPGPIMAVV